MVGRRAVVRAIKVNRWMGGALMCDGRVWVEKGKKKKSFKITSQALGGGWMVVLLLRCGGKCPGAKSRTVLDTLSSKWLLDKRERLSPVELEVQSRGWSRVQ